MKYLKVIIIVLLILSIIGCADYVTSSKSSSKKAIDNESSG